MPRGKKENPYEELSEEFKSKAAGANWEQLNDLIAEVTKAEEENQKNKADDPDLALKREEVKTASEGYRKESKQNKLQVRYLIEMQAARGRPVKKDVKAVEPIINHHMTKLLGSPVVNQAMTALVQGQGS